MFILTNEYNCLKYNLYRDIYLLASLNDLHINTCYLLRSFKLIPVSFKHIHLYIDYLLI